MLLEQGRDLFYYPYNDIYKYRLDTIIEGRKQRYGALTIRGLSDLWRSSLLRKAKLSCAYGEKPQLCKLYLDEEIR